VLPFANSSDNPQLDNLGIGIMEDLTVELSKLASLVVVNWHSTLLYAGKTVKIQEVSQDLGARYIVQGNIRTGSDRVLINAQLIDGTTGTTMWGERYDRPLLDLFAIQEEVRRKILVAIGLKLTPQEESHLQRTYTPSLEAYNYYARAFEIHFAARKPQDTAQARQLCEQAIALDPNYTAAYVLRGFTYWVEWMVWKTDPQLLEQAFSSAQHALTLDDSSPGAHELLGIVYLYRDRHYEPALAEVKRSIAISPNWFSGHTILGIILNMMGQPTETLALEEAALRLSPRSHLLFLSHVGNAYRLLRQYKAAIGTYKKVLSAMPYYPLAHLGLATVYGEMGCEEDAQAELAATQLVLPVSLETVKRVYPYRDPAELERHLAALRKAGLK
jgi:adenylate cyclase